jgi:hypothetical protein
LQKHKHLKVINVDRLRGFRGLDWIVMNEHSRDGWRVGIQCKKYISSSSSKKKAMGNPWGRTNSLRLVDHARKLEDRFGIHKRFALVASFAYRTSKSEKHRWWKLRRGSDWDAICVFESRRSFNPPYTYNLSLDTFDNIVRLAKG